MKLTCVHVNVKPGNVQDFIEAAIMNHENSVKEPGNMRFDIIQDMEDETKFILYEAYDNEESAAAHKKTDHYLKWRETVADWMAEPRKGIPYKVIRPV